MTGARTHKGTEGLCWCCMISQQAQPLHRQPYRTGKNSSCTLKHRIKTLRHIRCKHYVFVTCNCKLRCFTVESPQVNKITSHRGTNNITMQGDFVSIRYMATLNLMHATSAIPQNVVSAKPNGQTRYAYRLPTHSSACDHFFYLLYFSVHGSHHALHSYVEFV